MPETMQTIADRRTMRNFSSEIPERSKMEAIVRTAAQAPFGGATGIPLREIRKIFVFPPNSPARDTVVAALYAKIRKNARLLRWLVRLVPFLKRRMAPFAQRLHTIAVKGIAGFERGTYYVVVAEKKGFPPVAKQSLAHAMQNMWLASTDEGLGFQLLSATGIMSNDHDFMEILGLPPGRYDLDGCLIGCPVNEMVAKRRDERRDMTTWFAEKGPTL